MLDASSTIQMLLICLFCKGGRPNDGREGGEVKLLTSQPKRQDWMLCFELLDAFHTFSLQNIAKLQNFKSEIGEICSFARCCPLGVQPFQIWWRTSLRNPPCDLSRQCAKQNAPGPSLLEDLQKEVEVLKLIGESLDHNESWGKLKFGCYTLHVTRVKRTSRWKDVKPRTARTQTKNNEERHSHKQLTCFCFFSCFSISHCLFSKASLACDFLWCLEHSILCGELRRREGLPGAKHQKQRPCFFYSLTWCACFSSI